MKILYGLLLALPLTLHAAPQTPAEWDQTLAAKPIGNPDRGKDVYAEYGCSGCHGAGGIADNRAWPVLAGQRPVYLYKLLLDFREGRVGGPDAALMSSIAGGLNNQDIADVAAWLGRLPRPKSSASPRPPALLAGHRERLIPPCESCHGANGQGWEVQPALTGQNRDYFIGVLTRFKTGVRANDIHEGMAQIARALSDQDIRALADYYGR